MNYLHDLIVQYLPIKGVKPDARNARTHSKKQVEQIAASMVAFGFTNPLLIDEDAVLIAGHGRLAAAKKLGLEQVPAITLQGLRRSMSQECPKQIGIIVGPGLDAIGIGSRPAAIGRE